MKTTRIYRYSDNKMIAETCVVAKNFASRLMGLMGKSELKQGSGLLIRPCNSIHTFFMRFSIDVIYMDAQGKIIKIHRNMRPWRADFPVSEAVMVLELPVDGAAGLVEGELLCIN